MSIKNFVAKHGITTGSVIIDAATSAISTSDAGALQTKINLKVITSSTGSSIMPAGTTAQRDASPAAGYVRFNTTTSKIEIYNGVAWITNGEGNAFITSTVGSFITPAGTTANRDSVPSIGYLRYNTELGHLEVYTGSIWGSIVVGAGNAFITSTTGSFVTPTGTSAQRDSTPLVGYIRYNTDLLMLEAYNGTTWKIIGSEFITSPHGSLITPTGTTAERDSVPAMGYLRFNSELGVYEGYDGTQWQPLQLVLNFIDGGTYGASEIPASVAVDGGAY